MQYKLVMSEMQFLKDYQTTFSHDAEFFVYFYGIWKETIEIEDKTG